jgi:hypothetical protein
MRTVDRIATSRTPPVAQKKSRASPDWSEDQEQNKKVRIMEEDTYRHMSHLRRKQRAVAEAPFLRLCWWSALAISTGSQLQIASKKSPTK